MAESVTVTIPIPHRCLSPNVRAHWRQVAKHRKAQRAAAWLAAIQAQVSGVRRWERATIEVKWFGRTKQALRLDEDNIIASLKAAKDGLQDASLIENDKGLRTSGVVIDVDKSNPRVELVVTRTDLNTPKS